MRLHPTSVLRRGYVVEDVVLRQVVSVLRLLTPEELGSLYMYVEGCDKIGGKWAGPRPGFVPRHHLSRLKNLELVNSDGSVYMVVAHVIMNAVEYQGQGQGILVSPIEGVPLQEV